jgi:hypothetical protein
MDITAVNYGGFSVLCSEFGFEDLLSELSSFKDSHPEAFREAESTALSLGENPMKRLCGHEERLARLAKDMCGVQSESAPLACVLGCEEAKVASLPQRLEAQEGDVAWLLAFAAARVCDGEARGRLSLAEERLLSQEAVLEAVRAADIL